MTLIKSISGIRGTIGGTPGDNLTPLDIVRFTAAFGTWIRDRNKGKRCRMVVGRDARTSGEMVSRVVISTLQSLGIDLIDLGLATTPTVEVAVTGTGSDGGIIITASHNPANYNALKLLNNTGEFLSSAEGNDVLQIASEEKFVFVDYDQTGNVSADNSWMGKHIDQIMELDLVDTDAIGKAGFKIAVDCINSVGSLIIPELLKRLGVEKIFILNGDPDGKFAHNPEPLPENLKDISDMVLREKADLGFVVDPDVDRLAIVCEDGSMFGEEYTLVAVSDYVLSSQKGNTVSNMSSTSALRDITEKHGAKYYTAEVGEVNVVKEMRIRNAVIGGEGNGGIIYPAFHSGRDSLVGIAFFLSLLATRRIKCSALRKTYPDYFIAKKKITLQNTDDVEQILEQVKRHFENQKIDERDGIRIDSDKGWVHIRRSNTEPIIRIYAEGRSEHEAESMAEYVTGIVKKL
jgi:phosphomannomutase